ncbi:MAG: hypothetical protein ACRDIE_11440, partial [Chloroflexota bacterium]
MMPTRQALQFSAPRGAVAALVFAGLLGSSVPLRGVAFPPPAAHAAPVAPRPTSAATNASLLTHPHVSLSKMPLVFEQESGANGSTSYVAHGNGFTLSMDSTGPELLVGARPAKAEANGMARPPRTSTIRFQLVGATTTPRMAGLDKQQATVNYLVGSNPKAWHTGVPTFGRVTYKGVYPGIDVTYFGTQGDLEYDFRLAPG